MFFILDAASYGIASTTTTKHQFWGVVRILIIMKEVVIQEKKMNLMNHNGIKHTNKQTNEQNKR